MNPAGGPKGFWMNPCAYDSNRHKVVAYAGSGNAWAYDAKANTWTNLNASGGPTNGCGADEGPVFTYDAINDVFVYIAGCNASSANVWHLTLPPLGPAPAVSLSPPSLTFSSQLVGTTSAAQVVTLTNSGNATLSITQIVASGDFAQTNTCGSSLGAGANCTISVTFIPTAAGTRTGAVKITDNAAGSPQSLGLAGTGSNAPPVLSLSTSSLSFGSQAVGNASAAQVVTLSNSGGALSISSIAVTGTNAGDFSQSNTCGSSVAGGANCTISVTFKPTAAGSRSAAVSITDNATGSPQTVSLSGTGTATPPGVSLSTSSVNFGNQAVNTSSGAQTVTLSNTGGSSLSITGIAISGTNAGDFTQSNTCGTSVGAGANCTISVTFKPTAAGSRTGTMSITDNAAGSPQSVALSGTGVVSTVSLSASSLNFSGQIVGSSSSAQAVTLSNSGSAALSISSLGVGGANAGDFSKTDNCGASVAAGGNCTINVTFKPTVAGSRVGAVTITDNAAGSPQSVSLTGAGTDFSIAAAAGSSSSATVTAGQAASYTLNVNAQNGFTGNVTVSCTRAPAQATCTVPNQVTVNGASTSVSVAVTTTAAALGVPEGPGERLPPGMWLVVATLLLSLVVAVKLAGSRAVRPVHVAIPGLALLSLGMLMSGCSALVSTTKPPSPQGGTPAGTYTLTVTGNAQGAARTNNLTLIVK